jgi:hypothetical protein
MAKEWFSLHFKAGVKSIGFKEKQGQPHLVTVVYRGNIIPAA